MYQLKTCTIGGIFIISHLQCETDVDPWGSQASKANLIGELYANERPCLKMKWAIFLRNDTQDGPLASAGICTNVYLHTYKHNKKYSNRRPRVPKPCVSTDKQEIRGLHSDVYSSERDSSCNGQTALFTVLSEPLTQGSNSLRSGEEAYR